MIDWTTHKLINYGHNKKNEIILKLLSNNKEIVHKKVHYDFYFYILTKDLDAFKSVLEFFDFVDKYTYKKVDIYFKFEEEGKYTKVICDISGDYYFRNFSMALTDFLDQNSITHFDADLNPGDLYILDNNIEISEKYDILYFDIETDDRKGGIVIGRDRILSISGVDDKGNEFKFCEDNEKKILLDFIALIGDYDIISGWHSEQFDLPYIKARLKANEIFFSLNNVIHIDLMKAFMQSFAVSHTLGKRYLESFSLNSIAKEYLQDSKIDLGDVGEGYGGRMWHLFENDRARLLEYNLKDCLLLKDLNDKYKLLFNEIEAAVHAKAPLSKTRSMSRTVDFLLLREAKNRGIKFKTPNKSIDKPHQPGGAVLEPTPGLHNNINIYDFDSLYPNIFRTFNISPDSILEEEEEDCIKLHNGQFFSNKFQGLIPEVLDRLTTLRLKYKAEQKKLKNEGKIDEAYVFEFKQTGVKILILSIYGISGAPFSRFFDIRVASSICEMGQELLTSLSNDLKKTQFTVIYGDTDSIFIKIDDESKRKHIEELLSNTVNRVVKETNTHRKNTLTVSHEKILSKFIMLAKEGNIGAKKKYAGRCILDDGDKVDYLYYRGIELHKASELQVTKKFLNDILTYILWDNSNIEEIRKIIFKYKNIILDKKIEISDITITKKVGKMPQDYKSIPAHVKLAVDKSKEQGYFYVGMKVPYIVVSNNPLKVIHKDDFNKEFDIKYYWENQVFPPIYRILRSVYPNINWDIFKEGSKEMQTLLT